jgi:ribosomal protein S7
MARRRRAEKREIIPDAKFGDLVLAKFMNSLMYEGKKSVAEGIIYGAFDTIQQKTKQEPLNVFHEALRNVSPALEVRSRRVGGATYQVRWKCAPIVRARSPSAGSSRLPAAATNQQCRGDFRGNSWMPRTIAAPR